MYHTVQEVAELLRLSRRTVYRMIESGELEATKVGREWRVSEESLASLLGDTGVAAEARTTYQATPVRRPERPQLAGFMTAEEFTRLPEECSFATLHQQYLTSNWWGVYISSFTRPLRTKAQVSCTCHPWMSLWTVIPSCSPTSWLLEMIAGRLSVSV